MWEGGSEEQTSRRETTSSVESLPPLVPARYSPVTAVTLSEEESHRLEELAMELNLDSDDFFLSITCDTGSFSRHQLREVSGAPGESVVRQRQFTGEFTPPSDGSLQTGEGNPAARLLDHPVHHRRRTGSSLSKVSSKASLKDDVTSGEPVPCDFRRTFPGMTTGSSSYGAVHQSGTELRTSPRLSSSGAKLRDSLSYQRSQLSVSRGDVEEDSGMKEAIRKRVRFHHTVENIVIYEVNNQLWVNVKFQRNPAGWAVAVLLVLLYMAWDGYLARISDPHGALNWDMLFVWAAIWKLLVYAILFPLSLIFFPKDRPKLAMLRKPTTSLWLLALAVSESVHEWIRTESTALDPVYSPSFGPAVGSVLVLLLFFRYLFSIKTFRAEWILSCVVVFLSFFAVAPMLQLRTGTKRTFMANLVQLVSAATDTISFFLLERTQAFTGGLTLGRYFYIGLMSVLWNILFSLRKGKFDMDPSVLFEGNYMTNVVFIGFGSLLLNLLYLRLVRFVDVLSVGAVFAAKSFLDPFTNRLISPNSRKDQHFWNPWLWVTAPLAFFVCVFIVWFASIKRQIVVRPLHKAPGMKSRTTGGRSARGAAGLNLPPAVDSESAFSLATSKNCTGRILIEDE